MSECEIGSASMVYKFFDKKVGSRARKNLNKVLSQELHKTVIRNIFKRWRLCEV